MNCMLHFRKPILWAETIIFIMLLMGCNHILEDMNDENPLYGKNTDERILMCLEETYPEHQFHIVESYDKVSGEGLFADEKGLEFKVINVTYDSLYHFGCKNEYLSVLLERQGYIEKVETILQQYDLELKVGEGMVSTLVYVEETLDTKKLAEIVLEILNCVEVPTVIFPKEQGFSTGEINYYSVPEMDLFLCKLEDKSIGIMTGVGFYFEDKSKSVEEIEERIKGTIIEMHDEYGTEEMSVEKKLDGDGEVIKTSFSTCNIPISWNKNEKLSTEELYVYTENGKYPSEEDSYFIVACRANPYEASQHEIFRTAILSQLSSNMNIPEGSSINVTGFTSEQGITVYSFEIAMSKNEVMTMHYIIGEKQHCLIQEINYNNSEACSSAVQELVNSFLWRE